MPATEPLYRLDIVLDAKKPTWSWLQEMATLYRSVIINSNGKYKIISERDDLPVRQVFHSGNIIRQKTEIKVGGDPMHINQISAAFSNKSLDYERDILIVNDSQSVFIDNDPIKPLDIDLTGIVRRGEVNRRTSIEMQRRNEIKTEMTFYTNVEAINVEPGDSCIAGVIMSDFEMGYGGRALDGSTGSLLADNPIALNSGTNYDLWVWHVAADTPELRTLMGSSEVINLVPTSPFNYAVAANDRWAVAPQSESLLRLFVKKVVRMEDGIHQITGEQFTNVGFLLDCPGSISSNLDYYDKPSGPWSMSYSTSGCTVCVQLYFTAPSCIGGTLLESQPTTPFHSGVFSYIRPTTTNLPLRVTSLLAQNQFGDGLILDNTITFITGVNSGLSRRITRYPWYVNTLANNATSAYWAMVVSPLPNIAQAGDQYYITFDQGSNFAGFVGKWHVGNSASNYTSGSEQSVGFIVGNSGCFDLKRTADSVALYLYPSNSLGVTAGFDQGIPIEVPIPGCFNQTEPVKYSVPSITVQSLQNLLAIFLPASQMSQYEGFEVTAHGLMNDQCSTLETTKVSFGLTYAGSTIINSLVINLRDAAGSLSVGCASPFQLTAELQLYTIPFNHVRATLTYNGFQSGGTLVETKAISSIVNSVEYYKVQSLTMTTLLFHTDTLGAVHSHACQAVALNYGEFQTLDTVG